MTGDDRRGGDLPEVPPELVRLRHRLDELDRELVRVLAERGRVIDEVVHVKRSLQLGVVDRRREDEMLERIEQTAAAAGLDPRVARRVLRAVIDGFTLVEADHLGPDELTASS